MLNNRTLFPALFGTAGGGGGGSGQTIQVTDLPEAVLAEKDKIYQYIGSTTETLTNGFFYKCVEKTETVDNVITVTYEWENIPVMLVESGGGINFDTTETVIGTYKGKDLYARVFENFENQIDVSSIRIDRIIGCIYNFMRSNGLEGYITPHASYYSTIRYAVTNGIVTSITPTNTGGTCSIVLLYTKAN